MDENATKQKKKTGRKRKGKEVRINRTIRIEPTYLRMIELHYVSFQVWIDKQVQEEIKKRLD